MSLFRNTQFNSENCLCPHDLGRGGAVALWGLRAFGSNEGDYPLVTRIFERHFGFCADRALSCLEQLTGSLSANSQRSIAFGDVGGDRVSLDEVHLIAALYAGQLGCNEAIGAHLMWVLSSRPEADELETVRSIGGLFLRNGLRIDPPPFTVMM